MKDYLSIIITDGTNEWQYQGVVVPSVGQQVTCRRDESMEVVFGGEVENVHWEVREGRHGMVVTVWLKPVESSPQSNTPVTLAECPVGLFRCGGEICLKTEYGTNEGRIDAYIVSSGEFFWGGASNIAAQREVMVEPVSITLSAQPHQITAQNRANMLRKVESVLNIPSAGHASAGELADTILDALGFTEGADA